MSQKKNDNLSQPQDFKEQCYANYHKGSTIDFWISHGIPSKNTTYEKLGQTSIIFSKGYKPPVEDDSLEASIRYLKFKRFKP